MRPVADSRGWRILKGRGFFHHLSHDHGKEKEMEMEPMIPRAIIPRVLSLAAGVPFSLAWAGGSARACGQFGQLEKDRPGKLEAIVVSVKSSKVRKGRNMKYAVLAATIAAALSIGLAANEARACEPQSTLFLALCDCDCDPNLVELSGKCVDVGGTPERRGLVNIAQPYGDKSQLEFVSFKLSSTDNSFADQYITLAGPGTACAGETPPNNGNGCKITFNPGQPPSATDLTNIPALGQAILAISGLRQNIYFKILCDSIGTLTADQLKGEKIKIVGVVGFSKNGMAGTCRVDPSVKAQETPVVGEPPDENGYPCP